MSAPESPELTTSVLKNGQWFREWLVLRRFSDVEIAERLGVTTQTVANYKRSDGPLKPATILALDAIDAADLSDRLADRSQLMAAPASAAPITTGN